MNIRGFCYTLGAREQNRR